MLLYNYYTSSVVSWLLNAAAPTLNSMDGLIKSDFELIFEDIGYTRGWLAVSNLRCAKIVLKFRYGIRFIFMCEPGSEPRKMCGVGSYSFIPWMDGRHAPLEFFKIQSLCEITTSIAMKEK